MCEYVFVCVSNLEAVTVIRRVLETQIQNIIDNLIYFVFMIFTFIVFSLDKDLAVTCKVKRTVAGQSKSYSNVRLSP